MDARDYRPQHRTAGEEEEEPEFKPSKMGEPYNYPLPKSKEDPWMTLLKPLQEKDAGRCKAWREEVENLLIFAGLFSAVVTAFIVESYKTLQPDSSDQSVVLLSRILSQLESSGTVNTSTTTTLPNFSPTPSNVRMNILWFLSLVLSLATVLVGIVSLQWLREHQRPRPDIPPQLAYSLFHMHAEAIERWYLPQIFTMLPLLLQCALVLFFVGIIEFLWQLNRSTAIPVVVVIGIVLLSLALTTTLPSLQAISLFLPRFPWSKEPRVQCAYMSPQSWAFHRLIEPVINVIMKLFSVEIDIFRQFTAERVLGDHDSRGPIVPPATAILFRLTKEDSWLDHGIGWLYQRDLDFISLVPALSGYLPEDLPPMFDATQALSTAVRSESPKSDDEIVAVENCIQQLSDFAAKSHTECLVYLHRLHHIRDPPLSSDPAVQKDIFLFVSGHLNLRQILMPSFRRCKLELLFRLLEWGSITTGQEFMCLWRVILLALYTIKHSPGFARIGIKQPLQGILENFFKNSDVFDPRNDSVSQLQQSRRILPSFLANIGRLLIEVSPDTLVLDQDPIFESITSRLRSALDLDSPSTQPDFLFYTAIIHLRRILVLRFRPTLTDNFRILTATLLEYHARMGRTPELEKLLRFDYERQWLSDTGFVESAERCGIVYPPSDTMTPETEIQLAVALTADAENAPSLDQTQTLATAPPTISFAEDGDPGLLNDQPDESQPTSSAPITPTAHPNLHWDLRPTDEIDDSHTSQTLLPQDTIAEAARPHNSLDDSISKNAAERTPANLKMHIHIDMEEPSTLSEPLPLPDTSHHNTPTRMGNSADAATIAIKPHDGDDSEAAISRLNGTQGALATDDTENSVAVQ